MSVDNVHWRCTALSGQWPTNPVTYRCEKICNSLSVFICLYRGNKIVLHLTPRSLSLIWVTSPVLQQHCCLLDQELSKFETQTNSNFKFQTILTHKNRISLITFLVFQGWWNHPTKEAQDDFRLMLAGDDLDNERVKSTVQPETEAWNQFLWRFLCRFLSNCFSESPEFRHCNEFQAKC